MANKRQKLLSGAEALALIEDGYSATGSSDSELETDFEYSDEDEFYSGNDSDCEGGELENRPAPETALTGTSHCNGTGTADNG